MSVINRTLRELDARQAATAPRDGQRPAVPAIPSRRWRVPVAAFVGGTVLIASAVYALRPPTPLSLADRATAPVAVKPAPRPVLVPVHAVPTESAIAASPTPEDARPAAPGPVAAIAAPSNPAAPAPTEATPSAAAAARTTIQKTAAPAAPEEDADARYRKAAAWVAKGHDQRARPLLEEALTLAPDHARARQLLATLLNGAGQNREAEAVLRRGMEVSPEHAWFALGLARLEAARGDEVAAVATLARGLERATPDAEYHATLAALQLRLKRPAEAATHYALALKSQPTLGSSWLGLGLALEAQGKTDEARDAYTHALAAGNLSEKLLVFVQTRLAR